MQFNGQRRDYLRVLYDVKRPSWPRLKRNFVTVPGMAGAYLQNTDVDVREIEVPVRIIDAEKVGLQKIKEDLAAWLVTDSPCELIFDDEPDRIYYAVVDDTVDFEELVMLGKGTIKFICPDPYKYAKKEKEVNMTGAASFTVGGTVETEPVITVEVKEDTTFLAISNGDQLNMIGTPAEADQLQCETETLVLWDELGSLDGWVSTTSVEEGVISGTMKTGGYEFFTDDYGTDSGWHGPALKKSIGETLQDFRIDALVKQVGNDGQIGSVEIALLDVNNQFVAKMLLTKRYAALDMYYARVHIGNVNNGKNIVYGSGDSWFAWKSGFDGIMRLERVANMWLVYYARISSDGTHYYDYFYRTFVDDVGTVPIAQVQVQLWKYGNTPATDQRIKDIKIFRINPTPDGVPYVAQAGDVIEFDHRAKIIRRNGENIIREKSFIGEYFKLKPGQNTLVVEPSDAVQNVNVRWREKWR
jgi:predicted phage tail component-like protein